MALESSTSSSNIREPLLTFIWNCPKKISSLPSCLVGKVVWDKHEDFLLEQVERMFAQRGLAYQ